jgi:hypothetical protein
METVDRVLEVLNTADAGTDLTPVVITCRDTFYKDLRDRETGVRDAVVVQVKALTGEQVADYITGRFLSGRASEEPPGWRQLRDQIRDGGNPPLLPTLQVPWLMTLVMAACTSGRATLESLAHQDPAHLRDFLLEEFIPATVTLHPKKVSRRQMGERQLSEKYRRADRYDPPQVRRWLTVLARHLGWQASNQMSLTDLQPNYLWLIAWADSKPVRAVHTMIAVPLGLLIGSLAAELTGGAPGVVITGVVMVVGAGFGLRAGLWKQHHGQIEIPPAPGWQRWRARAAAWLRKAPEPSRVNIPQALANPWWAALIAAAGVAAGIAGSIDGGVKVGLTEALAAALAVSVLTGLSYGTSHAVTPAEPLTNDLVFGLVLGGVAGIATGLPGGLTGGLAARLHLNAYLTVPGSALLAIAISLLAGVALGSRAWLRYTIAIAFLTSEDRLPRQCLKFLDWAANAGLLRVSGIAYQFRHDDLRTFLADPRQGPP